MWANEYANAFTVIKIYFIQLIPRFENQLKRKELK